MEVRAILERGRAPLGLRAAPFFIAHPIIRNALKCIGVQQTDRSKGTASDRDGNYLPRQLFICGLGLITCGLGMLCFHRDQFNEAFFFRVCEPR